MTTTDWKINEPYATRVAHACRQYMLTPGMTNKVKVEDVQRYLWLLRLPSFAARFIHLVGATGETLPPALKDLVGTRTPSDLSAALRDAARPQLAKTGRTRELWPKGLFAVALADMELRAQSGPRAAPPSGHRAAHPPDPSPTADA